ncbi:L,D-transpeptidase family protein [Ostreiculturibacter nitratireducens]|uniref:L,D-transpeptidase family protein n=1 Tax=Ostreiculturibacter nitratireducens TaxID=3075226 RepID=UPI0031B5EA5E
MRFLRVFMMLALAATLAGCAPSKFRTYDGPEVTQVLVYKSARVMFLTHNGQVLKKYKIALGGNPLGPKQFEGDGKTPEGIYFIDRRNPNSAYHLSLGISYPNENDRVFASTKGLNPGGDIFIHGRAGANRGRGRDWTAGCIAVKDREIEEIYSMVREGTPIIILP